jgi:hypothetical protein
VYHGDGVVYRALSLTPEELAAVEQTSQLVLRGFCCFSDDPGKMMDWSIANKVGTCAFTLTVPAGTGVFADVPGGLLAGDGTVIHVTKIESGKTKLVGEVDAKATKAVRAMFEPGVRRMVLWPDARGAAAVDAKVVAAVKSKNAAALEDALQAGGNPNAKLARSGETDTALCAAAEGGDEPIIRILLKTGADPSLAGWNGSNPLSRTPAERLDILELLLDYGADPNAGSPTDCYNPLCRAAEGKCAAAVRLLISRGADASRGNGDENVLYRALTGTNVECLRALIDGGADPTNVGGVYRESPMHVAARFCFCSDGPERVENLKLLLERGGSLTLKDRNGQTPADLASKADGPAPEVLAWFGVSAASACCVLI